VTFKENAKTFSPQIDLCFTLYIYPLNLLINHDTTFTFSMLCSPTWQSFLYVLPRPKCSTYLHNLVIATNKMRVTCALYFINPSFRKILHLNLIGPSMKFYAILQLLSISLPRKSSTTIVTLHKMILKIFKTTSSLPYPYLSILLLFFVTKLSWTSRIPPKFQHSNLNYYKAWSNFWQQKFKFFYSFVTTTWYHWFWFIWKIWLL
jgi:hypothetical protein